MLHAAKLWFDEHDVEILRRRMTEREPTATALYSRAKAVARRTVDEAFNSSNGTEGQYPECCAICCLFESGAAASDYAAKAHDYLLRLTAPWTAGELKLAHWALMASVAHECCYNAWTTVQRLAMTRLLVRLVNGQKEVEFHNGNPHAVTNNHWAVSHGGALVAAMAAHGHPIEASGDPARIGPPIDLTEDIAWARARVKAFIMHHGDAGMYHEGLGYMAYPASYWLPAMIAAHRFDGYAMLAQFPNLKNIAASMFAAGASRPGVSDSDQPAQSFGMKLSWNDDGPGWSQTSACILMIHIAHAHQIGALRWMYDHLNGIDADRSFSPLFCGWFFALMFYPYDVPTADPNGILPRRVLDTRQGLWICRNRYQDGDDAIAGAYARVHFSGGHAQDDAGSLRLMALGHDWMMGGGQARGKAEWQTLVLPSGGREPGARDGAILLDEPGQNGGVFAMDLRRPSVSYHERYIAVDYSAASGSPVVMALLDQVDDHLWRDWTWAQTFEPGLTPAIHADHRGFDLTAADGATFRARFLGPAPASIEVTAIPASTRTFQSGAVVRYPPRPMIQARFKAEPHLGIYVVIAIQRDSPPSIRLDEGLDVRVGEWVYHRPFGAAIPAAFRLGATGGLCKYPAGVLGFRAHIG